MIIVSFLSGRNPLGVIFWQYYRECFSPSIMIDLYTIKIIVSIFADDVDDDNSECKIIRHK